MPPLNLTEPQLIFLGVAVVAIAAALIAITALGTGDLRCCRVCNRLDVVRTNSNLEWVEPTLCTECAAFKLALWERRQFRYRLPHDKREDEVHHGNR